MGVVSGVAVTLAAVPVAEWRLFVLLLFLMSLWWWWWWWFCCRGCGVQVVGVVIACRWMSLCVATVVVSPATIFLYIYIYPYSLYSILIQTDILYTL